MASKSNTFGRQRRPKGTGTVIRRGDRYLARIQIGTKDNGRPDFISKTYATETEANNGFIELQRKADEILGARARKEADRQTVSGFADVWLAVNATRLRPSTCRNDASAVKVWIKPNLGKRKLASLTAADLRRLQDAMRTAGRNPTSINNVLRIFKRMLSDGMVEGLTVPPGLLKFTPVSPSKSPRRGPTVDEAQAIIGTLDDPQWRARILTGLFTGGRPAEVRGITWDRLDLDGDADDFVPSVLFDRQLQLVPRSQPVAPDYRPQYLHPRKWAWAFVPTKTDLVKRVPLIEPVAEALRAWRKVAPKNEWGLVFTEDDGLPARIPKDRERWRATQTAAGVERAANTPFVSHEMRHATMSLLLAAGVAPEIARAITGHESEQAAAIYSHVPLDVAAGALHKVEGMFKF